MTILDIAKSYPIYTANEIKAWEQRWFDKGNSSLGLMQQASLLMANQIEQLIITSQKYNIDSSIVICCGSGNNGGDGYFVAKFLWQKGFNVTIFAPTQPVSTDCKKAKDFADELSIFYTTTLTNHYDIYIDALFGNGLDRELSIDYQGLIYDINRFDGLKIALDIPSGLNPDTGNALPIAFRANYTLCIMGLKMGLLTAKGRYYAGKIIDIPLIPPDNELHTIAWIDTNKPQIFQRITYAHKGHFGHKLIIGGHQTMGGAVILAGEASIACGAGKVTVMCHQSHHQAILSRSPNIMVKDIEDIFDENFINYLKNIDSIAFGMGLGRDDWSQKIYFKLLEILTNHSLSHLVLDADALYFLASYPTNISQLAKNVIATPHSAESAKLLNCTANDIENDRVNAIYQLQHQFGGNWVLKGAGSLTLEYNNLSKNYELSVCAFGNAGMATAGMGDVLSGMLVGLQSHNLALTVADCVSLHALAGDELAKQGEHGLQACDMPTAIKTILNQNRTIQ